MSKHIREKCGLLCISSIWSFKRGITPTKLDANWRHTNLICQTVKQSHMQNVKLHMSKNVREKCRKLRIFSILSSERGITPTKIDDTRTWSNVLKKKESYKISVPYVKAYRRKVRKTVTNEWTDGRIPEDIKCVKN